MESVHARSYSNIFSTLCSTADIDDGPRASRRAVPNAPVAIEKASFHGVDGLRADGLPAGAPASLSFDLAADRDIDGADVRVVFFRESAVLRFDRGQDHFGPLSLKKGERHRIEISYPALTLGPGAATAAVPAPDLHQFLRAMRWTMFRNSWLKLSISPVRTLTLFRKWL